MLTFKQWLSEANKSLKKFIGIPHSAIKTINQFINEAKMPLPMMDDEEQSSDDSSMLGAKTTVLPQDKLQDYLDRIYTGEKKKIEKYTMPYVHKSNIKDMRITDESGKLFDTDQLKDLITKRPENLLQKNEKIKHSSGNSIQFFNIGLPALKGLAFNERTKEFVVVDTCPGAGICKTYCYAKKGGYIQWKVSSLAQTRVLNYLLNDPEGFKNQLIGEIYSHYKSLKKRKTDLAIRWHDAGDFFSPDYWNIAKTVAETLPDVTFYAYTKLANISLSEKPSNFIINFSSGAKFDQEKQIDLQKIKHSLVVPFHLFGDIVTKKKGIMSFKKSDIPLLKKRIAQHYSIPVDNLLTYEEMMRRKIKNKPTYYVIVKQGDGDNSAYRKDVIGSYLLIH